MNKKQWMTGAIILTLAAPMVYANGATTSSDTALTSAKAVQPVVANGQSNNNEISKNPISAEVATVASFIEGAHKVDPNAPASLANVGKTYTMNSVAPMQLSEFQNNAFLTDIKKAMATPVEDPLLKNIETAKIDPNQPLIVVGQKKLASNHKDVADAKSVNSDATYAKADEKTANKDEKTANKNEKSDAEQAVKGVGETVNGTVEIWSTGDKGASFYRGTNLTDSPLNREGLIYQYNHNTGESLDTLVATHRAGGTFKTTRDIGIGNTRSELVFEYGSPLAMWRDNRNGNLIWLYAAQRDGDNLKTSKNLNEKKGISRMVENTYNSSSSQLRNPSVTYVLFTLKENKIATIDTIDSQVWPNLRIPEASMIHFTAGTMRDEDFSLGGYRLNDSFTNDPNRSWKERGTLYGDDFIGYTDTAIAYDKDHHITRVLLNSSAGVTRRGVSIGDSKYLLLYVYGLPDFEEKGPSTDTIVYGYAHPSLPYTYLLFTVGKEGFIKSVMLSNQKMAHLIQR